LVILIFSRLLNPAISAISFQLFAPSYSEVKFFINAKYYSNLINLKAVLSYEIYNSALFVEKI